MPGKSNGGSISERAMPKGRAPARDKTPDFVVRCKQGKGWMTIGCAWNRTNGPGMSIKLNAIPIGFDGTLKVLEPLEAEDEADGEAAH